MSSSATTSSKELSIEDLQPGMVLSEPVRDPETKDQLLKEGAKLTSKDIETLKRREIFMVRVTPESFEQSDTSKNGSGVSGVGFSQAELENLAEDVLESHEEEKQRERENLEEFYNDSIDTVRIMFRNVRKDKPFDLDSIREVVEQIRGFLLKLPEETLKITRERNEDQYLLSHTLNTTILAMHLGEELDFDRHELIELGLGCMLHDVGMTKIPNKLLQKEDSLTDKEYEVIKGHPVYKNDYLEDIEGLSYLARSVVHQHHERVDGSGYPEGLKNGEISKYARVASIADAYEAMVSPRVYRDRKTTYEAMQIIIQDAGTKFWEQAAREFYQSMTIYPIGSVVQLDDESIGVVHRATGAPLRPEIKLLVDEDGNKLDNTHVINLLENQSYFIDTVLDQVDV